jgi:hypothetical protein
MSATALIRIPFPRALVERLDQIAAQVRSAIGRKVSRAAVVRALVGLHVDTLTPELTNAIAADTVKRGPSGREGRVMSSPWKPSDPTRWSMLGLAEPPDLSLPKRGQTADVLAYALMLRGAEDPIEGILHGVQVELEALADTLITRQVADELILLAQRIAVAVLLLLRCDNRSSMPPEHDPDAPTATVASDEGEEEDVEVTRDADPANGGRSR